MACSSGSSSAFDPSAGSADHRILLASGPDRLLRGSPLCFWHFWAGITGDSSPSCHPACLFERLDQPCLTPNYLIGTAVIAGNRCYCYSIDLRPYSFLSAYTSNSAGCQVASACSRHSDWSRQLLLLRHRRGLAGHPLLFLSCF